MMMLAIYANGGYDKMHIFDDDVKGMSNEQVLKYMVYKLYRGQSNRKAYYDNNMAVVLNSKLMQVTMTFILDSSPWYDIYTEFHSIVRFMNTRQEQDNAHTATQVLDAILECIADSLTTTKDGSIPSIG